MVAPGALVSCGNQAASAVTQSCLPEPPASKFLSWVGHTRTEGEFATRAFKKLSRRLQTILKK